MASQLMSLDCVLIPCFSLVGNRHLFWGESEPFTQLTVGHEADKAPLQVPCRNKSIPDYPDLPLLLFHLPVVGLSGYYLTILCPQASCVSGTQDAIPTKHPPCPHSTYSNLCRVLFATNLPRGLTFNSQAQVLSST